MTSERRAGADGTNWPFTGRAAALATGRGALDAGRGVIVFGDGGVGKSRLAAELVGGLAAPGPWVHVGASRSSASTALGAWAHLLPSGWAADPHDVASWQAVAEHLGAAGRPQVLVEDAQWLDPASAALLHHLVATGGALAVVTSRRDLVAPQPITALWKDGHLERLDLEPFTVDEVGAMVEAELGAPVEPRTVARLHQRTGGNALLVREVVDDARRGGGLRLAHGAWLEETSTPPSPRLVDLLADRVDDLADDERAGAELVAVAGTIAAELLARALSSAVVQQLVERGIVRIERDGLVRTASAADPLMAEVLVERMGAARRSAVLAQLVELHDTAEVLDDAESLRVLAWRLELGLPIEREHALVGVDLAIARSDFALAEQLAAHAIDGGAGPEATIRLGEALMLQRRRPAAEAVLAPLADHLADLDDQLRFRYASARALSLGRELGRLDDAIDVLEATIPTMADDRWRWELEAHLTFLLADCGRMAAARPLAEARLANVEVDAPSALTAFVPSALIRTFSGRCHDTLALCEAMMPVAFAAVDARPEALGWVAAAQMLATYVDGDLPAAEELCRAFEALVADDPDPTLRAGILMSLGLALAEQGRSASALRLLQQAAALHEVDDRRGYQAWTFAITARAHAERGELAEARAALEAARRHTWPGGQAFDGDISKAAMWVAMLEGDRRAATAVLEEALAWTTAEGIGTIEIALRHEAVRVGLPAAPHVAPMVALVAGEQSRWGRVKASYVAALVAEDAVALVQAGRSFEALGIHLQAAEAFAQGATAHRRAGAMGSAVQARALAEEALARCEGAVTPGARLDDELVGLTQREAEVAALAAAGRSNQEIGAELGISVRTAETHLQRAFAKLGVHRRSELAASLAAGAAAVDR